MSIAQISKKAKSIRKQHPSMPWQQALRKAAAMLKGGGTKSVGRKRGHHKKTTHKRVSGAVGSTAAHKPRKRRKKSHGFFGATAADSGNKLTIMRVVKFGAGLAGGAIVVHKVVRPLEHKITEHFKHPMVAKALPYAEAILGTWGFLKSNNLLMRGASAAVAGAGVHAIVKSFGHATPTPQERVMGLDESFTSYVPVQGQVREMISGLINDGRRDVRTNTVAGRLIPDSPAGKVKTPIVGQSYVIDSTPVVGGGCENDDYLFMPKGRNY